MDAFDPNEFAAFKAQTSGPDADTNLAPTSPSPSTGGGFDPAEFQAFKARSGAPSRSAEPSFDERFGSGPTSAADAAPRVGSRAAGEGQSVFNDQAAADALYEGARRAADERLVGKPSLENQVDAGLFRAADAFGLNAPRNMMAAAEKLRSGKSFDDAYRYVTDVEDALARQNPGTALGGTVAGVIGGSVALPALSGAPTRLGRAGQAAVTGAGYGAAAEAIDSKDVTRSLVAGSVGGALGGVSAPLIEKTAPIVLSWFRSGVPFRTPEGRFTPEAESALREAGIDMTDLPPALAGRLEAAFRSKGISPGAAREAAASEFDIPLSTGQATRDPRALDLEGAALSGSRGGRAQGIGADFQTRQDAAIREAGGRLQGMAARGGPLVDNPAGAFEAVADRARAAGGRFADDAARARAEQDAALQAVQGPVATDPLEGATAAVQGVRETAGQRRAAYGQAYDDLDAIEGAFAPAAFARAGDRIRGMIGPDVPIAADVTPAAARALGMIDELPRTFGLRPDEGPTLQQVNAIRKGISRLHPATAQNGSDRYALGAVRDAFDRHVQDMAEIGQFRPGPASARGPGAGGDGDLFSTRIPQASGGGAGEMAGRVEAPPPDAIMLPQPRQGEPESLTRFLARNGGVPLDAETRAADLHRTYVPGTGTLARRNAPSWDQLRIRLSEANFLPREADGYASANDVRDMVLDAIHSERIGRGARGRMGDEMRGPGAREAERVADQNADHAAMVDREARRLAIDLEPFGITGNTLDRAALREAAEARVLGHADDGVHAYDAAVARRANEGEPARSPDPGRSNEDAPFPALGEGVGPAGSTFPAGDTGPADAMRRARGLFRDYKQAFTSRGTGDVAGQRLQRIAERDASPNEAVAMLFGSTTGRVGAGQLQTLSRLRAAVGADSEPWRAVQQSLISRYISGDGRDLGRRLDYLLRGEGRQLATSFLSDEQRAGLGRLRASVAATDAAQTAAPTWVQGLERDGFDPNRISASLFGSGVPGSRPGALNEAKAAKAFLGEGSQEWSMLRQAAVQRVTGSADQGIKAGKVVDQVRAFTDGPGAGLARELFSNAELGQMRRYAMALRSTLRPDGTMKPESGAAAKMAAKALDVLAGAVAFKAGGPAAGIGAYGAKVGQRALIGGVGAARARRSFEGGAPRVRAPAPMLDLPRIGTGSGLAAEYGLPAT